MLRSYQNESVIALFNAIHSKTNTILQLPTGTGKTTVIADLIKKNGNEPPRASQTN